MKTRMKTSFFVDRRFGYFELDLSVTTGCDAVAFSGPSNLSFPVAVHATREVLAWEFSPTLATGFADSKHFGQVT